MSTSKSLPRTLDAWVQHLGKLPLPIEQQQHLRLRRILGDSRRTWREIAEAIESSPSFALQVLRERIHVPMLVDAGLGLPSHACTVMEWGFDAVLLNTAVALAQSPVDMAGAFADAVRAAA